MVFLTRTRKKIVGSWDAYLLPIIAAIFIASPLPTEIGVALMAAWKKISINKFIIIAYLLHTLGIFIILLIGNV